MGITAAGLEARPETSGGVGSAPGVGVLVVIRRSSSLPWRVLAVRPPDG